MKSRVSIIFFKGLLIILLYGINGCGDFIVVDELEDQLLAKEVFNNDATANSAINGIYRTLREECFQHANGINLIAGLASDELASYFPQSIRSEFQNNQISVSNNGLPWARLYNIIYQCNSAIEGLTVSNSLKQNIQSQLIGESKFLRAFCYFYLVNFFGDIPLLTTTNVEENAVKARKNVNEVYELILSDLNEAEVLLREDFSASNGNKIRANRWAASALLARVYLYQKRWTEAEEKASSVINSTLFQLITDVDSIAIRNNREAILQLATSPTESNIEASFFIFSTNPVLVCTNSLVEAFEPNDERKKLIQSNVYNDDNVYYPFKYHSSAIGINENTMIMRLAEQYLIRAEARSEQGNFVGAIEDINIIREKHGKLTPLSGIMDREEILDAIMQERRIEFFAEGGHRWFDLKRTGRIESVLTTEKPGQWFSYAGLWPIPLLDIQRNTNLSQNPGYE